MKDLQIADEKLRCKLSWIESQIEAIQSDLSGCRATCTLTYQLVGGILKLVSPPDDEDEFSEKAWDF